MSNSYPPGVSGNEPEIVGYPDEKLTWTEQRAELERDGYAIDASYRGVGPRIDQEMVEHQSCEDCGHERMAYHKAVGFGSYRAFAVCPNCDASTEF